MLDFGRTPDARLSSSSRPDVGGSALRAKQKKQRPKTLFVTGQVVEPDGIEPSTS
jgi:hypothetical protein